MHVRSLVETMERNESYIYWLQPKNGGIEDQFASININGKFYHLNSKLEKAIFRNVSLKIQAQLAKKGGVARAKGEGQVL